MDLEKGLLPRGREVVVIVFRVQCERPARHYDLLFVTMEEGDIRNHGRRGVTVCKLFSGEFILCRFSETEK